MTCKGFAASLGCAVAALAFALSPSHAQKFDNPLDQSLHSYSVQVLKTRVFQHEELNGIYLGRGAVLTAAHVVGRFHLLKELQVRIAGQELPAKIVKEGSSETIDLTVLSVDEELLPVRLRLRQNPVCKGPVVVGREAVVVASGGTARSRVISPLVVPAASRARFGTVISDVPIATSGAGVFDADKRCLLGIISRQIPRLDAGKTGPRDASKVTEYAKYFVPAPTIASFLPEELRF
jgi:hypothetical protein